MIVGQIVGAYAIGAHLGGLVYLARRLSDSGLVVLKLAEDAEDHPQPPGEAEFMPLHHPNVVRFIEVGRYEDQFFGILELLHGVALDQLVAAVSGPFPIPIACRIVADAAAGVAVYQNDARRGALRVHRGVRPEVFITTTAGVTKLVKAGPRALSRSRIEALAEAVRYFAPEQFRGESVGPRADVFALGCVLWELTTGQRIFSGRTLLELTMRVFNSRSRAPSSVCPGYPAPLEAVVMRAISIDPERRYANAGELFDAVRELGVANEAEVSAYVVAHGAARLAALDASVSQAIAAAP